MNQLLPTIQARHIQESLRDYLTTTFGLADAAVQHALEDFLTDQESGIFRGPYVRTRAPFKPSVSVENPLSITPGPHTPYGHQAEAFVRLSSRDLSPEQRPQPTLVTTGTGSGKTEAFLYPILDHIVRHKIAGGGGISALILYPMNALATDQSQRLAEMITEDPQFAGIRAAIYTGEKDTERSKVTKEGLITSREAIRKNPPDILLTNYKMLNQLLLREHDAQLWEQSALSLQYLVLDEFHTYDGAQGTDVALLLRRLGLKLKKHWPESDPRITDEHRARPLGRVTPVATSATMGDKSAPDEIMEFAHTVFGEEFGPEAIVTESRYSVAEWAELPGAQLTPAQQDLRALYPESLHIGQALEWIEEAQTHEAKAIRALATTFRGRFSSSSDWDRILEILGEDSAQWLELIKSNEWLLELYENTRVAIHIRELAELMIPRSRHNTGDIEAYLSWVVAGLSLVRAEEKLAAPTVDVHMWVRALSRIDRELGLHPVFDWSDDGEHNGAEQTNPVFPAIFCRNCGRSGWAALRSPESANKLSHTDSDKTIRAESMIRSSAISWFILADAEASQYRDHSADPAHLHERLWAYRVDTRDFIPAPDAFGPSVSDEIMADIDDGRIIPVLRYYGKNAEKFASEQTCPACEEKDSIRFLGAAVATLLSVSLSTLFGEDQLREEEKKTLVFTDSVQDAAHRAGFVESRSYVLTLRGAMAESITDQTSLGQLDQDMVQNAETSRERFRLLPPDMTTERFGEVQKWWQAKSQPSRRALRTVENRIAFDASLEFGLQARYGRTLETTGAVSAIVSVPDDTFEMVEALIAKSDVQTLEIPDRDFEVDAKRREAWVRGVLHHMRISGAIDHPWLDKYKASGGARIWIWGKRRRSEGMPAFPTGRSAPAFPTVGMKQVKFDTTFESVDAPRGWFARYTAKMLNVSTAHGARLARDLMDELHKTGILSATPMEKSGTVYGVKPDYIELKPAPTPAPQVVCAVCRTNFPISPVGAEALTGTPCLMVSCTGTLGYEPIGPNFYRDLYRRGDLSRIVAREHSGILTDILRREYEDAFKGSDASPDAPNVLVATPTLEMGIDIGDLSNVMLASLPRTVASYVQRVGRAGRVTGNALNLAFVNGRGRELVTLNNPESVINGAVVPPATYLDAVEIVKRQYIAFLADHLADDPKIQEPQWASELYDPEQSNYLEALENKNSTEGSELVEQFLASLDGFLQEAASQLREWVASDDAEVSGLSRDVWAARRDYQNEREQLLHRYREIIAQLPELQAKAEAGSEEDRSAFRQAQGVQRAARRQLDEPEFWVGALEFAGLLPNYTLIDDSTTLNVDMRWRDEDARDEKNPYKSESFTIDRGTRHAMRDFAPGSTFYGNGMAIKIDAVDFGLEDANLYTLTLCPECGYSHDERESDMALRECPRCASTEIADRGQQVEALEMRRVHAMVNRDEARISDGRDERNRRVFEIRTLADIDRSSGHRQWFVEGFSFGVSFLTSVSLRTVNFGSRGKGNPLRVSSDELSATQFIVCESCGKLDQNANANSPYDHRPWCPHRNSLKEHNRKLVLTHTLDTQGALFRLPLSVFVGDSYALASMVAAIRLGLTLRHGGEPNHIEVITTEDPQRSGGVASALLLHDTVPGGTGYLAELADPKNVWKVLWDAWETVRDCSCQHEGMVACPNCLLPFEQPNHTVSRASAERVLGHLLAAQRKDISELTQDDVWEVTEEEPEEVSPESYLEGRFFEVFQQRLEKAGMDVRESVGQNGLSQLKISRAGIPFDWVLSQQPDVRGITRPDFELRCNVQGVPVTYIYTDGVQFHASLAHQRVADDAKKRDYLRSQGHTVISLTLDEVEEAARDYNSGSTDQRPVWFSPKVESMALDHSAIVWTKSTSDLLGNPIDFLIRLISDTKTITAETENIIPAEYRYLGKSLPVFFLRHGQMSADISQGLRPALLAHMKGEQPAADGQKTRVGLWEYGPLSVMARLENGSGLTSHIAVILDDRDYKAENFTEAWRIWLHLSNLLNFGRSLSAETTIGTLTQLEKEPLPVLGVPTTSEEQDQVVTTLSAEWQTLLEDELSEAHEKQLLRELAANDAVQVPEIGEETSSGIMMDFSWPQHRIAVLFDTDDPDVQKDIQELKDEGWIVVDPSATQITNALVTVGEEG